MKIGKRVLKTVISTAICLCIYLILMCLDKLFNLNKFTLTSLYTPFFATIASVYTLQQNSKDSIKQAKIRSIGSLIGGYFGAIIILIFEFFYLKAFHVHSIKEVENDLIYKFLLYLSTCFGLLILIPFGVKLKKQNAIFISCLTYLSVTISIRNGGMEVFLFATNRILSTIIGVVISLFINTFPHFRKVNKNILFLSSIDNVLLKDKNELSPYTKYCLNNLYSSDCNLIFMSTRTLTSIEKIFQGVNINKPIIVMNGCALYNNLNHTYSNITNLNHRKEIENIFEKYHVNYFSYIIEEGILNAYYLNLDEDVDRFYYEKRKSGTYYSFNRAKAFDNMNVIQYVLINKIDILRMIKEEIINLGFNDIFTLIQDNDETPLGYGYLRINSSIVSKDMHLNTIKNNANFVVCFGSGRTDLAMMDKSDLAICLKSAPYFVKNHADYILESDKQEDVINLINSLFKTRHLNKSVKKLMSKSKE